MSAKAIRIPEIQDKQMGFGEVLGKLATIKVNRSVNPKQSDFKFIDLFAGMGGIRLGFEKACQGLGFRTKCVLSSEIKSHAINVYKENFNNENIYGDITAINAKDIPNFDYLLAGFPCQAFSTAGKRKGFADIRGTLFFDIVRILKEKKPQGFILENVDGLVKHNNGETFEVILNELKLLGYNVSWKILNASDFGIPQNRKRIYILGHLKKKVNLDHFETKKATLESIVDDSTTVKSMPFVDLLLKHYTKEVLAGKSIKDRRGGKNNIHSWDIELKGKTTQEQKDLMNILLKKRRMKHWAIQKNIVWMDGMPLTIEEISTFYKHSKLQEMLDDLTQKGYLKYEYPKNIFVENGVKIRKYDTSKEKGYNIVAGKLSFPLSTILSINDIAPTIVATEIGKIAITAKNGIRNFTIQEGLGLFGYPKDYKIDSISYDKAFDLLGNTVIPPIIEELTKRLLAE